MILHPFREPNFNSKLQKIYHIQSERDQLTDAGGKGEVNKERIKECHTYIPVVHCKSGT